MSQEIVRTAAHVAADINNIKFQTSAVLAEAGRMAKRSSVEIGRLLEEAKCLVPHGEWGAWLKTNVDYSESTANNLMRCYREFGDEQIDMISGVSDAEFFAVLTQSQMVELFALPKPERRAFVEEHREELESGEMSTRDLRAEVAKLTARVKSQDEQLEKAKGHIEGLEKTANELTAALDEERRKPASEPIVQETIVHQPSEEQLKAIRAQTEESMREAFEIERAKTLKECRAEIAAMEQERDTAKANAEKEAKDAKALDDKIKRIEADHAAAVDKLKAEGEAKLAAAEAAYKKQVKAGAVAQDPSLVRVQVALEAIRREMRNVATILYDLEEKGKTEAASKLKAQVEKNMGTFLADVGWKP
jgi:hypothetical protein